MRAEHDRGQRYPRVNHRIGGRRQGRLRHLVPEKEAVPARLFRLGRQVGKDPGISIGSKIGDVDSIPHRYLLNCDSVSLDRKSTRLNSSHANISYAVFCLKKKKKKI